MKNKKFSLIKRFNSFGYAFNGLKVLLLEEHNSRVHLVAAILAVLAGFYYEISNAEWLFIIVAIGSVLAAELFNSAIENLADKVCKETNPIIKKVKDLAAAGVLIVSIMAFVIGLIIFIPKL
ncbi:MAG: diacylglycerol kinase family protein [Carboxylicivirga sp.]|jgi:diacylglycerol kinase|nr:diacylglycerol kinase family protein [Carboxylicivirga sp.]